MTRPGEREREERRREVWRRGECGSAFFVGQVLAISAREDADPDRWRLFSE